MIRTRVGYAGGSTSDPTYRDLGDHSETIQIDFDPTQITYEELLDLFWASHDPTSSPWSRQYASIVFFHDEEQRRLAVESSDREAANHGEEINTEIVPFSEFYLAEGYHQKYRLQQESELLEAFRALYPSEQEFIDSTATARANGYAGGYGTLADLERELGDLGLSPVEAPGLWEILFEPGH